MQVPVKCFYEERKKSDDPTKSYYVLSIPDLEKIVFLTPVENKLAKLLFSNK